MKQLFYGQVPEGDKISFSVQTGICESPPDFLENIHEYLDVHFDSLVAIEYERVYEGFPHTNYIVHAKANCNIYMYSNFAVDMYDTEAELLVTRH